MKVLHVALYDRVGGACIAGYRQHQALQQAGVDSRMWVRFKVTNDPTITAFQPSLRWQPRLTRLLRRYLYQYQWRRAGPKAQMSDARSEHGADMLAGIPEADVINIQFGWQILDYPSFFSMLPRCVPIVVTMHGMEAFTGGCSYAGTCQRFYEKCGNCPKLTRNSANDLSRAGWKIRQQSFAQRQKRNLHFVADSRWLAGEARKSGLLKDYDISVIYYGLDTTIYRPLDKKNARENLGVPASSKVVAFAAASVDDPRKGIRQLTEAVMGMEEKPFLLTWGRKFPTALEGVPHLHLGNIESEHLMAIAYNASDVFVMPSLEEAFGQTALEAGACGVPVVAFAAGGIPEIVLHKKSGILCEVGNIKALQRGIIEILKNKKINQSFALNAENNIKKNFSFRKNAESYYKLYQELINKNSGT